MNNLNLYQIANYVLFESGICDTELVNFLQEHENNILFSIREYTKKVLQEDIADSKEFNRKVEILSKNLTKNIDKSNDLYLEIGMKIGSFLMTKLMDL